ncbi:PREDICTED: tubby-related protein 4 [Ceratosolen solmsi marchali]|uniref:Tubby-related protein 4 n=1 Tax=Ceratosolen solmsi marchali TaxID=326594 RepID=A0AAJ7DUT4_9HYME|nr:PREDICTED: tubby-related protein 4 [Ceratosolen solmsi marchali]
MHLYFERNDNAKCDCNVLSLSWMGKLPDELQEDESWKLYRRKYYQEGWLATGNARGLVGVTFTTSHCRLRTPELPLRANYNLRGHRSEVILVKWNEPYQKLASCDSTGVIFVWIKYDGRWSIELINDRSTPVTHFSWSHDGRMALICYKDGFVLVGSVAGQRYWSSMLNHKAVITCGIWTPDDQQVYFGTTAGQLIVMDVHGAMVSEIQLGAGVTSMAWSAEKFKLEEDEDEDNVDEEHDTEDRDEEEDQEAGSRATNARNYVLAVCLADGNVVLLRSFDDVSPVTISTGLKPPLHAEWSNSWKLLAIAGIKEQEQQLQQQHHHHCHPPVIEYTNLLKFYSDTGILIYTIAIPYTQSPVTAMTWGHNDRRLFVATGTHVHAAWVSRGVGSLQLLSRLALKAALTKESSVQLLPLPPRLKALVSGLFANTIRCCIPEPRELRRFVSRPPPLGGRLHCTMLRNQGEPPHSYTLYVEYLGGLIPLLKGRRTSKIRPEFVIFDPESGHCTSQNGFDFQSDSTSPTPSCSDDSDNERDTVELCAGSPRFRRKSRRKCRTSYERSTCNNDDDENYVDTLPEKARLVEVTSNIWGTKFKFHGLADSVPANLGRVTYRPSLLHLQPRQMTLVITELRDDLPAGPDPSFNPNLFSEDEEECMQGESSLAIPRTYGFSRCPSEQYQQQQHHHHHHQQQQQSPSIVPLFPVGESHDDDYPYEYQPIPPPPPHQLEYPILNYCETMRPVATPGCHHHRATYASRCCDVPTLQSPKNAVAPTQTLIATSSPSGEYSSNVQRVKTALVDQQNAISSLIKKELDVGTGNKLVYAHTVEDKFHIGNGSSSNCCLHPRAGSTHHQGYSYANGECGPTVGSIVHSKNNLNVGRQETAASLLQPRNGVETNHSNSIIEDEERRNDVPALKSQFQAVHRAPTVVSIGPTQISANSIVRSCSVGYLDLVDAQIVPCDVALNMLRKDAPNKRLFLISRKNKRRRRSSKDNSVKENGSNVVVHRTTRPRLNDCGKSRSLDSSELFTSSEQIIVLPPRLAEHMEETGSTTAATDDNDSGDLCSEVAQNEMNVRKEASTAILCSRKDSHETVSRTYAQQLLTSHRPIIITENIASHGEPSNINTSSQSPSVESSLDGLTSRLDGLAVKLGDFEDCHSLPPPSPRPSTRLPRSSPSSPAPSKKGKRPASASPIRRRLLSSPLLNRKTRKNRNESSDEEGLISQDDISNYRDLETFQKAQLRQKLRKRGGNFGYESEATRREIIMHNKAPMWNEANQVYQLDFGGRVTQESAKNFQIEFRGNQVMQFGRIQGNAYTLDFQYPFSAIQAFAVALASVTQRLK